VAHIGHALDYNDYFLPRPVISMSPCGCPSGPAVFGPGREKTPRIPAKPARRRILIGIEGRVPHRSRYRQAELRCPLAPHRSAGAHSPPAAGAPRHTDYSKPGQDADGAGNAPVLWQSVWCATLAPTTSHACRAMPPATAVLAFCPAS